MKEALVAGNALYEKAGIFVDEYAHEYVSPD
jgi:hypothetical protein